MTMMKVTTQRVLLALALFASTSCDPSVIAPLPSPLQPDGDRITTSSLSLTEDTTKDQLVAVVGFPGSVGTEGVVRVVNQRTLIERVAIVSAAGTFSAGVYGQAGDELELVYETDDERRSDPIELVIAEYTQDKTTSPPNGAPQGSAEPPATPNYEFSDADGAGCTEPNCPPVEEPAAVDDRLAVIWSFDGTTLHLEGGVGFTSPNANVVVSNQATSAVAIVNATDTGAAIIDIAASVGDQIILFAQSSTDPSLTSPAITFKVPEAGAESGTDTPSEP